ncbi:MAG TPA: NAD-dependent epimerase/dehydratase family protein [Longimicrobium sp.]
MGRTALITGATGFVGGHLAERLAAEGWTVRALVRPSSDTARLRALGAELAPGSLDDVDALTAAADGADTVFHLAALTTAPDEAAFRRANAEGTANVARAALRGGTRPRRLVYLSSYAACGPAVDGRPRRMDETPAPLTAYGRTKLEGEQAARQVEPAGVELVTLRAPAVYGPGDKAFLPVFRMAKLSMAPVPTGPVRHVHLVYVHDLVTALANAADAVQPGTYAVAEPVAHPYPALVAAIGRSLGKNPVRLPVPAGLLRAAGSLAERFGGLIGGTGVFSREKADEMLAEAWVCDLGGSGALLPRATPLEEGLAETARWYRTQGWL